MGNKFKSEIIEKKIVREINLKVKLLEFIDRSKG